MTPHSLGELAPRGGRAELTVPSSRPGGDPDAHITRVVVLALTAAPPGLAVQAARRVQSPAAHDDRGQAAPTTDKARAPHDMRGCTR